MTESEIRDDERALVVAEIVAFMRERLSARVSWLADAIEAHRYPAIDRIRLGPDGEGDKG